MDDEKKKEETKLQWHPAFYAGIQIEFESEKEELIFENEHQLGTKPMAVDVIITKKKDDYMIKKKIGRIFRKYNLLEYKAPGDSLTIDDFYKVCSYAGFFKADAGRVNEIKYDEITISLVSYSYPREMIKLLKKEKRYRIKEEEKGLYYIEGGMFPAQLIVTRMLSEKENFWLHNMTNKLKTKERVYNEYQKHKNEKLYKSVMDVIVKANKKVFNRREEEMCQALFDIYKEDLMEMAMKEVKKIVREEAMEEAKELVREEVKDEVRNEVNDEIRNEVKAEVRSEVKAEVIEKQRNNIMNLMKNAHFTLEQAFDVLMVPEEERKLYNFG